MGIKPLNPTFRSRGRSPEPGNAISVLFGPMRTDLDRVSAQTIGSGPESWQFCKLMGFK